MVSGHQDIHCNSFITQSGISMELESLYVVCILLQSFRTNKNNAQALCFSIHPSEYLSCGCRLTMSRTRIHSCTTGYFQETEVGLI
uniref:Uncharacterized protein n=1 Tax=Anguilla anguilla TaxID=7936 RepID=A0A0E9VK01_ANGAN